jgi:hypothetical protein
MEAGYSMTEDEAIANHIDKSLEDAIREANLYCQSITGILAICFDCGWRQAIPGETHVCPGRKSMNETANIETRLLGLLKGEYSSLHITFNDHASDYMTAKEADKDGQFDDLEWVSQEDKQKALENNSVWSVQWYPNTPVGFNRILGSSLESCVNAAHIERR